MELNTWTETDLLHALDTVRPNSDYAKTIRAELNTRTSNIIDSTQYPMDHQQFIGWYNRCGGKAFFEATHAIELDHEAALGMECGKQWLAHSRIVNENIATRTTACPNEWHRSAPARTRITCPECPE